MKNTELILAVFALMLFPFHRRNLQAQQFLPVGNIVNARDLGGYPTADGKIVRSGLLLRSASLADASEEDLAYLAGISVGTIVDFRMDFELRGKEDKMIPGAHYVRLPINSSGMDTADEDARELSRHKSFDVRKSWMNTIIPIDRSHALTSHISSIRFITNCLCSLDSSWLFCFS